MTYNIALVGNPNCGKTTLFNELTGSNQYVGNWSGVTVEKKIGKIKNTKSNINLVDLPGIYSLSPYSLEEIIARDFIINENPDLIINIVDGTNIERNLYLTIQLLELGVPVVVAINMMDDVESRGDKINFAGLIKDLGVSIVPIVARKNQNLDKLIETCECILKNKKNLDFNYKIKYDENTMQTIDNIYLIINKYIKTKNYLFFVTKLIEGDSQLEKKLGISNEDKNKINNLINIYQNSYEYGDRETIIADTRYKFITNIVSKNIKKNETRSRLTLSDKIDMFVTNRFLAIPIFLIVISFVFWLTFGRFGSTLKDFVVVFFNKFIILPTEDLLVLNKTPHWTHSLLIDAVIKGVGAVLEFLPQIMILFLFLSILEDTGYMARAAFIMDRFLNKLGLNGKSFIPMLMGFGCTTPAVMAARTMENEKDKKLTILLIPFMSCGAKLTVYMFLANTFFKESQGLVIFSLYFIGLFVAIVLGVILKNTLFKDNVSNFIMELPPYRWPTAKTVLLHVWEKCKSFLIKAGTIIFSMCILIWILQNFDFSFNYVANNQKSMLGYIGRFIAPIFRPLGFGQWEACVSLVAGLIAKESVISTMNILYNQNLLTAFSPAQAFSFMVFILLYMPCVSAFVSMKKELGNWKWAIGAAILEMSIAYFVSMIAYNLFKIIF
ncbi:MAG: ferrous iron transport protein B [Oscillospiraceae bacterium]|nr:ferrous iron transport protein B [Oscillospiraceae bacterium]